MEQRLEQDTVLFLSHVDILKISSLGLICCLQTVSDQRPLFTLLLCHPDSWNC